MQSSTCLLILLVVGLSAANPQWSLSSLTGGALDRMKGVGNSALGTVTGMGSSALGTVTGMGSSALSSMKGMGGAMKQAGGTAFNTMKGIGNGAIDTVTNLAGKTKDMAVEAVKYGVDQYLKVTEYGTNLAVKLFMKQFKFLCNLFHIDELELPAIDVSPPMMKSFKASGGYFKKLTSLDVDGKIRMRRENDSVVIEIPMEFDDLKAGYANYELNVGLGIGMSGSISVSIEKNKLLVKLRIHMATKCFVDLEEVSFGDFEGVKVDFTGMCGLCGKAVSSASNWIVGYMQNNIKTLIRSNIQDLMEQVVEKNTGLLCSTFMSVPNDVQT